MRKVMDEKKILILNLSKGRIGEDNSLLLGALLITKLQLAAMSRVDIPEEKRKDFFLYVDEFQNFATESFVNILSEARKYRLALILGHQYINQMDEKVRDAVFGNVGTIIAFRVGAEDAEYLEKEFTPEFMAADLVNLAKYNIYLKLMIDGLAGRSFSAETLPPISQPEKSVKEKIIKVSRERYGTPRRVVEEKISRWTGVFKTPETASFPPPAAPVLYDARCSLCGKETKVIFPPDQRRPIYCKSCLKKREGEKNPQRPPLGIPMKEALSVSPIPFSVPKKETKEKPKPKRKEVNLEELKKVLEKSLGENLNDADNASGQK
jgi:CxxC-x17-CxxC domain-containing protein